MYYVKDEELLNMNQVHSLLHLTGRRKNILNEGIRKILLNNDGIYL